MRRPGRSSVPLTTSRRFYGGSADIELYRTETALYRDNLASGSPGLWVVMIPTDADPPYKLLTVTADPAEGEGLTESAANIVEQVPMPASVVQVVERFIAEHHVEREFIKRKRDRADPERPVAPWLRRSRRMTADDDFLSRWSRRKQAAEAEKKPPKGIADAGRSACGRSSR